MSYSEHMKLGELEKKVMECVWNHYSQSVFTVRDVVDCLHQEQHETYAYNTILTVVTHLHNKKLLHRKKSGKTFTYTVRLTKTAFVEQASASVFNQMRKDYGVLAIAHFAQMMNTIDPALLKKAQDEINKHQR